MTNLAEALTSRLVESILNEYLQESRLAQLVLEEDPQSALQMNLIRDVLVLLDTVMAEEGFTETFRRRIISRVLYGSESPEEGLRRIEERDRRFRETKMARAFLKGLAGA